MFHSSAGSRLSMIFDAQLVGARDHRAARLARVEERVAIDLARDGVVDDVARLEALVLRAAARCRSRSDSMRTISFCSSPIEPDTSIM